MARIEGRPAKKAGLFARLVDWMTRRRTAIAWENHRARFNHALGIEAQGFSEGADCPLPERAPG